MTEPAFDNEADPVGEALLESYLDDHGYAYRFDADTNTLLVGFGDPDRVPPLPDPDNLPYSGKDLGTATMCAFCATSVRHVDGAGWRHLAPFAQRDGCNDPDVMPDGSATDKGRNR